MSRTPRLVGSRRRRSAASSASAAGSIRHMGRTPPLIRSPCQQRGRPTRARWMCGLGWVGDAREMVDPWREGALRCRRFEICRFLRFARFGECRRPYAEGSRDGERIAESGARYFWIKFPKYSYRDPYAEAGVDALKNPHYCPKEEYEAAAVCIGIVNVGYRANQLRMSQLNEYKWCCVRQLISRHSRLLEPARTLVLLRECFESMKRLQPQILASYMQVSFPGSDMMAEMMLLDGCFILHRLLKYARRERGGDASDQFDDDDDDWTQVYGRCWVWQLVTRDLLLLENQIPFLVVRELFQVLKKDVEREDLLVTGSLRLFRSLSPQKLYSPDIACDDVHHLLHLFYLSVGFPPSDRQRGSHRQADGLLSELPQWIPCAKELEEAGVRFRKRKNATSFLDIRFARGVLEIPQLQLNDSSESLFRNLIAFEQTYPGTRRDVSTYAVFMDCLINSPQDMRILALHGVLVNHLNSGKVAWRFFSVISAQVHWSTDNYLVGLMDAVNRYRDSRRHRWRAALVRNYFSNPWVAMSVLAALLLLGLTILQTFFTVYPYFERRK